ncbi:hypothetical protein KY290_018320 [Solanum tuberosum]|uniref:Uncharacterized protein n=1 Tax=Solanum tuberosum TaxID=4113 RepID=A0ABQ7VFZ0_SOLTU|nr:hypothetical protein KY290_018320 [Solanum tuberosum]
MPNLRGRRRSVLNIPELEFNVGWKNIGNKIGRFINASLPSTFNSRLTDKDIPYSEAVRSSKWGNMEFISTSKEEESGLSKERAIHIDESFDPS